MLAGSRPAADIVAFDRTGAVVDLAQFHRDVGHTAAWLEALSCKAGLLACADGYWTAVGLAALFVTGAKAALAPALRPEGGASYRRTDEILITDQPPADDPRAIQLGVAAAGDEVAATDGWARFDPRQCRLDLFTSGSTGAPKRISKSLEQLEREAQTIESLLAPLLPAGSQVHATVPHHHLYGLTFSLVWPLLSRRPFNRQPYLFWEDVFAADLASAVLVTSPAHLTRLAGFPPLEANRHPALVLSAGAALPAAAAAEARLVLGRAPTEIFGSTETGAIAVRDWNASSAVTAQADLPWSPLPGVVVTADADGRLLVSSPFIEEQPFLGADLITLEADGRFHALGRADDICKIEGKRISLTAVEQSLRQLAGIADAAALVIDDGQPRLAAVIQLDPAGIEELQQNGAFRLGQALRRRLAGTLEPASLPKRWRFVTAIPAQAMGKRRRADLLALFDGPLAETAGAGDEPQIRDRRYDKAGNGAIRLELDLYVDPALPQLDGHFPGLPIVPGVALVDWAARLAQRHLQIGDGVVRSLQVKFRRLMQPGQVVTLVLEHQVAGDKLAFTYRDGDEILAS
ncbi:MAG TPA: AMP-binding protein, partial [Terriglobales bacterium]|nr:AMP-binding protein [Terriglobales bacterium]